MALPTSRNTTYTSASPVLSADLNALQDQIVGAKRPSIDTWQIPLGRAASEVNITWDTTLGFVAANPGPANFNYVPLNVLVGTRLTSLRAIVLGTGAATTVTIRIYRGNGDGTISLIGALVIASPPAAWAQYAVALTPEVIAAGKSYWYQADITTTGQKVAMVGYSSDRL
jgi:hypothetical protein